MWFISVCLAAPSPGDAPAPRGFSDGPPRGFSDGPGPPAATSQYGSPAPGGDYYMNQLYYYNNKNHYFYYLFNYY